MLYLTTCGTQVLGLHDSAMAAQADAAQLAHAIVDEAVIIWAFEGHMIRFLPPPQSPQKDSSNVPYDG